MTRMGKVTLGAWILVVVLLALVLVKHSHASIRYQLSSPSATLSCQNELSAIKESMFQSSMGEAILAKQVGNQEEFNLFLGRAHVIMHTDDLKPSPKVCEVGNLKALRIMAAGWEYDYLLDQATLFKLENQ